MNVAKAAAKHPNYSRRRETEKGHAVYMVLADLYHKLDIGECECHTKRRNDGDNDKVDDFMYTWNDIFWNGDSPQADLLNIIVLGTDSEQSLSRLCSE